MEFETNQDAQEYEWEGRRHALATLLRQRGAEQAAAIVAISHYRIDWTRDDTCVVTLSVPAEFYDLARGDFSNAIGDACAAVAGRDEFDGVNFCVKTPDPQREQEWIDIIVRSLDQPRWVPSERAVQPESITV